MNFKPMLAADASTYDLTKIRWPMLISPKLDGLRCIVWEGVAYSRNAKPFRNYAVQEWAAGKHNLDGELIVGSPTAPDCLNVSKAVTAFAGEPDFTFHLFDSIEDQNTNFQQRLDFVQWDMQGVHRVVCVPHVECFNAEQFAELESSYVADGYEGVMLRHPTGPYKHGRSTMNEQFLMKHKRFTDGEAVVESIEEGNTNINTLKRDELGRAKRATHADGLIPSGMLGTLICIDPVWGRIRVAPGIMPHSERIALLKSPQSIVGRTIHWRSFGYGSKDAPRFARYYGLREDL